jgi:DNA-binding beta-propeller fold protein YncE
VEALPGSRLGAWGAAEYAWQFPLSAGWRLLRLAPDDLEPEAALPLAFAPSGLCVAPDGAAAYAFDALGDGLLRVDLATGQTSELARVPGHRPWGLAATADRLFVASPPQGQVWALDGATGRRLQALPVGRAPAGIGLAP